MEVTREELRRNGILRRGLLGNKVSGNSAADQMKEMQAGMLSPKTPQQNLALLETYTKPQPFTPDARYYPNVGTHRLDLVPGKTFPSPAQAYMAEVAAARAAEEEIQRGLLDVDQPNGLAGKAADVGADLARDQNTIGSLSGLLGDLDYKGMLNQLFKTFQRPEMLTPGVNALTSFGMSGAALNQAEMAGAAAEQERMDKFAMEQIKNAPGAPKLTGDAVKLYDRVNASRANASLVQKMKIALTEGTPTGAIGTGEQALIAMLNALNIPIGTASSTDYDKLVAELKAGMLRSGRLLKADFQLLEKQLPNSGTFKNKEQLLNSLRSIEEKSNRQLYEDQQLLSTFGLPAGSGAMPSTMIRSRNN